MIDVTEQRWTGCHQRNSLQTRYQQKSRNLSNFMAHTEHGISSNTTPRSCLDSSVFYRTPVPGMSNAIALYPKLAISCNVPSLVQVSDVKAAPCSNNTWTLLALPVGTASLKKSSPFCNVNMCWWNHFTRQPVLNELRFYSVFIPSTVTHSSLFVCMCASGMGSNTSKCI